MEYKLIGHNKYSTTTCICCDGDHLNACTLFVVSKLDSHKQIITEYWNVNFLLLLFIILRRPDLSSYSSLIRIINSVVVCCLC